VLNEESGTTTETDKDCLIRDVIPHVVTKTKEPVVIVFAACFYGNTVPSDLFNHTREEVARMLEAVDPNG